MMNDVEMSGEELGDKLLQSVKEMKSKTVARTTVIERIDVAKARLKTGLSVEQFAAMLQISSMTLYEWEQGLGQPSGAAKALIQIAFRHPEVIQEEFENQ